jgi:homeobox protein Meis1
MATELDLAAAHGRDAQRFLDLHPSGAGLRYANDYDRADWERARQNAEWEDARKRCMIFSHPLYAGLLQTHAACLCVGTPVDQIPDIQEQLSQPPMIAEKYKLVQERFLDCTQDEQDDLNHCMAEYTVILATFAELLQRHVHTDVTDAMMSCWNLEKALHALTGATPEAGHGATMSDDDDDYDSDYGAYEHNMDYNDSGGYGPLVPTETERSLVERVRQELKHELKQGYKSKIEDVREEILRKRRAGKLPEGTTTVLKAWWHAHSKWPYPTEDEKEILIQETGLELKQVNNWFINQRKRNWHSNPLMSAQSDSKTKVRKSW